MKFLSRLDDFEHIVIDGSVSGTGLSSLYLKDTATPILRIGNNSGDSFITYDGSELSISSDVDLRFTTPTDQDVFLITSTGNIITTQAGGTFTIGGGLTLPAITGGFLKTDANGVVSVDNSSYLTAESDTLDSVTDRGATTTNNITVNNLIANGSVTSDSGYLIYDSTDNDRNVLSLDASDNTQLSTGTATGSRSITFLTEGSEQMRINALGNVGIGTTSPAHDLHVDGDRLVFTQTGQTYTDGSTGLTGIGIRNTGTSGSYNAFGIQTGAGSIFQVRNDGGVRVGRGGTDDRDAYLIVNGGSGGSGEAFISLQRNSSQQFLLNTTANQTQIRNTGNLPLYFYTNDAVRMTVAASGNVGIGTTAPNVKLEIKGAAAENTQLRLQTAGNATEEPTILFRRNSSAYGEVKYVPDGGGQQGIHITDYRADASNIIFKTAGGYERMRISHNGNVGIGTASPNAQLEIRNNEAGDGVGGATLRLTRGDGTSVAGDPVGTIEFYSTDADTPKVTAYIKSMSEELYGREGSLAFGVSQAINTDATEAMRITNDGKVGVGTSAPATAMHIYDVAGSADLKLQRVTGYPSHMHFGFPSGLPTIRTSGNFAIKASDVWGADFYINSSGNVGIGTTSPGNAFEVKPPQVSFNLSGLPDGTIALSNNSSGANSPTIAGKSLNGSQSGLQFIAGTPDTNSSSDMIFSVRENDNTDFSTTSSIAYSFFRYTTPLFRIYRDGDLQLPQYGAGLLKTDANGNVSLDTSTYLTSVAFSDLTSTPTTIAGYGITDALEIGTTATTALAGNTFIPVSGTDFDPVGTDNSTDVTLNTTSYDYLSITGQEITLGQVDYDTDIANTPSIPASGTDFDPVGTDNSTDVTLDTSSYDYLSITNQEITLGQIDYDTDIANTPTLGTAAATDSTDYATAAQGSTADSALQPGDADLTPSWVPATDPNYLTSYTETQTLDDVTDLGATTTNGITVGQLSIDKTADNTKITFNSHSTLQGATGEIGLSRYDFSTSKSAMSFYTNNGSGLNLAMRIRENGNVGIGVTGPATLLTLSANLNNSVTFARGIDTIGALVHGVGTAGAVMWLHRDDVTIGDGNLLGRLNFSGADGGSYVGASILGQASGAWSSTNARSRLIFETTSDGATDPSEKMRIQDNGNVGIGTINPTTLLELKSTTVTAGLCITAANNAYSDINLGDVDDVNIQRIRSEHSSNSLLVYTNNSERMRINSSGNVGIGTTIPGQRLHVVGKALITDDIQLTGSNPRIDFNSNGASSLRFYDTTNASERMRINTSGNVGIGTIAPDTRLHIVGTAETRLRVGSSNASSNVVLELRDENTPTGQGTVITYNNATGETYFNNALSTATTDFHFQSGEYGTANDFFTLSNSGGNSILHLKTTGGDSFITYENATNELAVASDGDLRLTTPTDQDVFFISSGGNIDMTQAGGTVDMGGNLVVDGDITGNSNAYFDGNVGIGTTNPSYPLDVVGSGRMGGSSGQIGLFIKTSSSFGATISFEDSANAGNDAVQCGAIGEDFIIKAGYAEAVRVNYAKNVGIGTTDPQAALHINKSGVPQLLLDAGGNTTGDLVVPDGEILQIGHWNNSTSTYTDRLRMNIAGQIGINTETPGYQLTVVSDSDDIGIVTASSDSGSYIGFIDNSTTVATMPKVGAVGNKLILSASQYVGVLTTNPLYALDVSGTIRATGDVIAFSDARVKENVETIPNALDKVKAMRGVEYNKIGEEKRSIGVIAQEMLEVMPEVVHKDDAGMYSVAYGNVVGVLIEAMKEQQKQIDELKALIASK